MPECNKAGLDLIRQFEGISLRPYKDAAGYMTVGYGHKLLPSEAPVPITKLMADNLLQNDVDKAEEGVDKLLKVPVTSNQYSAIIALTFNIGLENFKLSSLLKLLNAKEYVAASEQFKKWVYATVDSKKVILPGLVKRREAERKLFIT